MPHLIIEHSADISPSAIQSLQKEIKDMMPSIAEGNFDADQCKCRSHSFDEYLVGKFAREKSSFLHITIKILSGRPVAAKQQLAEKSLAIAKKTYETLEFSPSATDQIVEVAHQVADAITGVGHISVSANSDLINKRCDISVDIVDMDSATYRKIRLGN